MAKNMHFNYYAYPHTNIYQKYFTNKQTKNMFSDNLRYLICFFFRILGLITRKKSKGELLVLTEAIQVSQKGQQVQDVQLLNNRFAMNFVECFLKVDTLT